MLFYDGAFFEISAVESPTPTTLTSWFVDNSVVSNGTLFLATPLDPLLLALPHLSAARGHVDAEKRGYFTPLSQSLGSSTTRLPPTDLLLAHFTANPARLALICDAMDGAEPQYRLNDEKLHSLLTRKVAKAAVSLLNTPALRPAALGRAPASAGGQTEASASATAAAAAAAAATAAAAAAAGRSNPQQLVTRKCKTAAATQLVTAALAYAGEYLPPAIAAALVGLFQDEKGAALQSEVVALPANRAKGGAGRVNSDGALTGDLEISKGSGAGGEKRPAPVEEKKATAGDRARAKLAKSAVGMGSIASFFKKV